MKQIKNNVKNFMPILVLFIFCGTLSFFMCFSPFAQGKGHGWDAAIYAAIGNAINHGRILYTGIVDNKGPLIYFIDALGLKINYHFGIFAIECLFLLIGTIFAYKTAKIITGNKRWLSCFSTIFAMLLLVYTLDSGNYTEEYALLFTNIATYYVVKFLVNDYKLKWFELIMIGCCFAATFLLRANLCAFFVCQILVIFINLLKDKKYNILFTCMGFVILGILLFLTPFLIYLIKNEAFVDCLRIVYFDILNSFSSVTWLERFSKVCDLIEITNASNVFSISLLAFTLFLTRPKINKNIKKVVIISFLGLVLNLYVNSITGGAAWAYTHYFISFAPIVVVIAAWFFNYIYERIYESEKSKELKNIIFILLGFIVIVPQSLDLIETAIKRVNFVYPDSSEMEQYILDNSEETDTIQVIEVNDSIYYPTNRIPTSKHLYFVSGFNEERRKHDANELANDLYSADKLAKIIMLPSGDLEDLTFIKCLNDKDKFIDFLSEKYTYDEEASEKFDANIWLLT